MLAEGLDDDPHAWMGDAACREVPLETFFPDAASNRRAIAAAKAVCETCPVREPCLAYALAGDAVNGAAGIFGGLTARERTALLRARTGRVRLARDLERCPKGHRRELRSYGWACPTCIRDRNRAAAARRSVA